MSRKHFEAIAQSLRRSHASQEVIEGMADTLAGFNPMFDRARFIEAATDSEAVREQGWANACF
jgi:hypothetical protein